MGTVHSNLLVRMTAALLLVTVLPSLSPGPTRSVPEAEDLVGMSREQVLEQLGIPSGIGASLRSYWFEYDLATGRELRIDFFADRAVLVAGEIEAAVRSEAPNDRPYPTQSIAELVRRHGSPESITFGPASDTLVYPEWAVDVAHGMVTSATLKSH